MDLANGCWLPPHVLVEILKHVPGDEAQNVTAVSKLWRACLWESRSIVEFRVGESADAPSAPSAVHELAVRFPLSTTLRVVARPLRPFDLSRFSLCRPLAFPPRLSRLELHKVQIDAGTLDGLLNASQLRVFKCCHVEFIDVTRWKHSVPVASSASGEPHPPGPASVRSLSLTDCQFLTARGVGRQAEKKKALSAFLRAFSGVAELTLESMELSDGLLGESLAGLGDLTTLNLAGSRGFSYRAISRVQRFKLKELVLSACYVLNDDMCRVICTVCPGLEVLGVYEGQISTTIVNLISSLSHLKTLDMGYSDGDVSPIDLQRMLAKLGKGLRVLNLGGVEAVNDFVMLEIARMRSLKRCALTLACMRRRSPPPTLSLAPHASLVRIARIGKAGHIWMSERDERRIREPAQARVAGGVELRLDEHVRGRRGRDAASVDCRLGRVVRVSAHRRRTGTRVRKARWASTAQADELQRADERGNTKAVPASGLANRGVLDNEPPPTSFASSSTFRSARRS